VTHIGVQDLNGKIRLSAQFVVLQSDFFNLIAHSINPATPPRHAAIYPYKYYGYLAQFGGHKLF